MGNTIMTPIYDEQSKGATNYEIFLFQNLK